MSEKTPGEMIFFKRAEHAVFWHSPSNGWNSLNECERDDWEFAANAVRQPLLDRIAELEEEVSELEDKIVELEPPHAIAEFANAMKDGGVMCRWCGHVE